MVVDTPTSSGHGFCQISASDKQVAKVRQASSPEHIRDGHSILDLFWMQKREPLIRDRAHPCGSLIEPREGQQVYTSILGCQ